MFNISRWFLNASLRIKLLLPVLFATALILFSGGWYLKYPLYNGKAKVKEAIEQSFRVEGEQAARMHEQNLLSKGESLGNFAAMSVITPLMNNDFARLLEILDIALFDKDIVHIYISDVNGKLIVGQPGDDNPGLIKRSYEIDFEGEKLGYVNLALSRGGIDQAIAASDERIASALFSIADQQRVLVTGIFLNIITILVILIVVYIGFTFLMIEFLILRPLRQTEKLIDDLTGGKGDLTRQLPMTSDDEIGRMRAAVNRFIELLRKMMLQVQSGSADLSETTVQLAGLSHRLIDSFTEVNRQEVLVHELTESVSDQIRDMASTAEEISVNTSSVSSSSEEMSTNVNGVSEILSQLNQAVANISDSAARGTRVVEDALESSGLARNSIHGLDAAAGEIDHVTEMIKRIAEQTNLLALNATIEAASAGEHGRGFAVVAGEIKELAGQSSQSAGNIASRIEEMQGTTRESVEVIHTVIDIIQKLADAVALIHGEIQTTSSISTEITTNMGEAASGISSISGAISEIAKGNNDLSAGASSAVASTQQVVSSVRQVKEIVDSAHIIAADVEQASKTMEEVVGELNSLVGQFKLS